MPDIRYTIDDLIAEGDRVVVRWTWHGTHTGTFRGLSPTNKRLTNTAIAIHQIKDGKVVRIWLESDRLGFLEQVGVVPAGIGSGPPKSEK